MCSNELLKNCQETGSHLSIVVQDQVTVRVVLTGIFYSLVVAACKSVVPVKFQNPYVKGRLGSEFTYPCHRIIGRSVICNDNEE